MARLSLWLGHTASSPRYVYLADLVEDRCLDN